jgi:hypothetical protein
MKMQKIIEKQQELIRGCPVESENFMNISGLIGCIPKGETRKINGIEIHRTLLGFFRLGDDTLLSPSGRVIALLWNAQK